jgi:hypothetical protein
MHKVKVRSTLHGTRRTAGHAKAAHCSMLGRRRPPSGWLSGSRDRFACCQCPSLQVSCAARAQRPGPMPVRPKPALPLAEQPGQAGCQPSCQCPGKHRTPPARDWQSRRSMLGTERAPAWANGTAGPGRAPGPPPLINLKLPVARVFCYRSNPTRRRPGEHEISA